MRSRRPSKAVTIGEFRVHAVLAVTVLLVFASWTGCGSGSHANSTTTSGAATETTGPSSSSSTGGAGGASGSSSSSSTMTDGGPDADAAVCTAGDKTCDGKCVGATDPAYGCTTTGCTPCSTFPNATAQCTAGACALGPCDTGYKNCDGNDKNGCEVNIGNDPMQCGACGVACVVPNATASCTKGVCGIGMCDMGWTDCDGDVSNGCEANLPNDPMNCGMCGNVCPGQSTCQSGVCGLVCPMGTVNCPTDPPNVCATNLGTNTNCAFCDDACDLANADSQCMDANDKYTCDLVSCNAGYANCDAVVANGCEIDTNTDPNNCGACGNVCTFGPNSTPTCTGGICNIACDPGYLNCDGDDSNGCEINGQTNSADCGACGTTCSMSNATESCTAGACQVVTCSSGFADCDKLPADGCEVNTQTDPNNCGTCGTICKTQNGTPACVQGMCAVGSCSPGFAHCPGKPGTNCETSTGTDVNNCGTCGNVCSSNNDTPSCSNGTCSVQCSPGYGNCDGFLVNGCETSLGTVTNCGSCGVACTTLNGIPACNPTTMTCAVAGCSMGYANCPGNGTNCLTYIGGTDPNNCGGCNVVCPSDASNPSLHDSGACAAGTCTVGVCDSGWADCDGNPANGCETQLGTITNCGGCGQTCTTQNGTPECLAGACKIASCNTGYASCPGNGNNCSTDLNTDPNNCGACGAACDVATCGGAAGHVSTTSCSAGACDIATCASGYASTDTKCSDGIYCECPLSTTSTACPGQNLGTFPVGATPGTFSSNLYPGTLNEAYFTAEFTGNADDGTPANNYVNGYHPTIVLSDPSGEGFVMDITSNCGTLISNCNTTGDAATSAGVTTWEVHYTGGDSTSKTAGGVSNFDAIPPVGNNGTVDIKVYRKSGVVKNCAAKYTITVTNP